MIWSVVVLLLIPLLAGACSIGGQRVPSLAGARATQPVQSTTSSSPTATTTNLNGQPGGSAVSSLTPLPDGTAYTLPTSQLPADEGPFMCPVTYSNGSVPAGGEYYTIRVGGHGNGKLCVNLPLDGTPPGHASDG